MSRIFLSFTVMSAGALLVSSCATREVAKKETGPPKEFTTERPANAEEPRVVDIRYTHPAPAEADLPNPDVLGNLPTAAGDGVAGENLVDSTDSLPAAASLGSASVSWKAVPSSPLMVEDPLSSFEKTTLAAGAKMIPDAATIEALVSAMPALTGASMAEPFILSSFRASGQSSNPNIEIGTASSLTSTASTTAVPRTFLAPPPPKPVTMAGSRFQSEIVRPSTHRMHTSEHEAE